MALIFSGLVAGGLMELGRVPGPIGGTAIPPFAHAGPFRVVRTSAPSGWEEGADRVQPANSEVEQR
jgi:hypothetical protein